MVNRIIILFFFCSLTNSIFSQTFDLTNYRNFKKNYQSSSSTVPVAASLIAALYIFNPIINYEDRKFSVGITKEFSVGFGYFGQYRSAIEFTYNFKSTQRNSLRLSGKYDILLAKNAEPSNMLQGFSTLSIGGGYFTNFKYTGFFPEVSYGYSIRNDKFLIYPHIKFRHTFINQKNIPDITDVSAGIMIGIANPFIDLKIRRKY